MYMEMQRLTEGSIMSIRLNSITGAQIIVWSKYIPYESRNGLTGSLKNLSALHKEVY